MEQKIKELETRMAVIELIIKEIIEERLTKLEKEVKNGGFRRSKLTKC